MQGAGIGAVEMSFDTLNLAVGGTLYRTDDWSLNVNEMKITKVTKLQAKVSTPNSALDRTFSASGHDAHATEIEALNYLMDRESFHLQVAQKKVAKLETNMAELALRIKRAGDSHKSTSLPGDKSQAGESLPGSNDHTEAK